MTAHPSHQCPDGVHIHAVSRFIHFDGYLMVVDSDTAVVALVTDRQWAARIAELVNRHGITDVPDDVSALTAPWPAPDPRSRKFWHHGRFTPIHPTSAAGTE